MPDGVRGGKNKQVLRNDRMEGVGATDVGKDKKGDQGHRKAAYQCLACGGPCPFERNENSAPRH